MPRDIRKMPMKQSFGSYRRTLKELDRRADAGVKLDAEDSEDIGNKFTTCTLGLCDRNIRDKMMDGIYQDTGQVCPQDSRYFNFHGEKVAEPGEPMGCFFKCHVFKGRKVKREDCVVRIKKVLESVSE